MLDDKRVAQMTQYIIDAVVIPQAWANLAPTHSGPSIVTFDVAQKMVGIYEARQEAEAAYDALTAQLTCLAAALVKWTPGSGGGRVKDMASRCCAGGVPTQTLIRHGDRTWRRYNDGRAQSVVGANWRDYDGAAQDLTTQPAPGHRLSARTA